jgi:hypothetical protein
LSTIVVPLGQFHFTFVFKIPFRILFVLRKSLIVLQYNQWNNCTPLNQSASSNFVMLVIRIIRVITNSTDRVAGGWFVNYEYDYCIYYIHDKITAIWLVKRSAIISLIALSRMAGGSGKSKQQNPIWRRNLDKYF